MIRPCVVPGEDLVAYDDGYLTGGRRELVETHLAACPHCQARLRAFREVDEIIRRAAAPIDDRTLRAALHDRLLAEASRPARRQPPRRLLAAIPSALLLLTLLVWPLASTGGFELGRFIRFGPVEGERDSGDGQRLEDVAPASVVGLEVSFAGVEPDQLPLALSRVSRSVPEPGLLEVLYRSSAGLAILVTQTPVNGPVVEMDPFGAEEVVSIRDTPVLRLEGARPGTVSGLYWERKEVVFELLVTDAPPEWLGPADATRLVEALMAAQDAGPG